MQTLPVINGGLKAYGGERLLGRRAKKKVTRAKETTAAWRERMRARLRDIMGDKK